MLKRLNQLAIFDPGRWPGIEIVARVSGAIAALVFAARRLLEFPRWPGYIDAVRWAEPGFYGLRRFLGSWVPPGFDLEHYYRRWGYSVAQIHLLWGLQALLWSLETGVLLGYLLAYLTRDRARSTARGFMETAFTLAMAGLPFVIVSTPPTYRQWAPEHARLHLAGLCALNALLILGSSLNLVGLLTLRRSFAILCEARTLVRSGIYRRIRHPLYASHFLIYFGYTLIHFHPLTIVLYGAFVAGQVIRARLEEAKLGAVFPEYGEYRQTTGMFLPRLRRGQSAPGPGP